MQRARRAVWRQMPASLPHAWSSNSSHPLSRPSYAQVTFYSGGVPEPAQDEGGVAKEFFQVGAGGWCMWFG